MYRFLAPCFLLAIFGLPLAAVGIAVSACDGLVPRIVVLSVAPLAYALGFVLVAGTLSLPFHRAIVSGRFARDLSDPRYRGRRLYGLCWTSLYYCKPVYFLCLSIPALKHLTFRLFGYRGSMEFTVYPDSWIRDLPLLDFGPGAYIANRATLGTNLATSDGRILVGPIRVGAGAMVGHLAKVAAGSSIGARADLGVGCSVGVDCRIGDDSVVQPNALMNHFAAVGSRSTVGTSGHVGLAARIGDDIQLPQACVVPNRARIDSQSAADAVFGAHLGTIDRLGVRLGRGTANKTRTGVPVFE